MTSITQERTRLANVGMRHRRREQWGSTFNYTNARTVDEPATKQKIHISVTNPPNYNSFDAHARGIEAIGRSRFPATGGSYNRLHMAGTRAIYELQPVGRRGAHTVNDFKRSTCSTTGCPSRGTSLTAPGRNWNLNYNARAYAYASNVQFSVPDHVVDDIARALAADRLAGFVTRNASLHGHRCVSSKSCPGNRLWARMGDIKKRMDHYLRVGLGTTPPPPPPPPGDPLMAISGNEQQVLEKIANAVRQQMNGDQTVGVQVRWGKINSDRILDAVNNPVPPNAWMRSQFEDIPEEGYRPRIYGRAAYGHARKAAEGIEVTVIPLLEQLVAAQGGDHHDAVLADIQSKLHQAQQERLAIASKLDEQSAALVDVRAVLEEYQSGVLDPQELADALIRRFQLPADEPDDEPTEPDDDET